MSSEIWRMTAVEAVGRLKKKEISPLDLVEASAKRIAASFRVLDKSSSMRFLAAINSELALSAAAKPAAMVAARSSSALTSGGHMYFIVNPTKIRNTII